MNDRRRLLLVVAVLMASCSDGNEPAPIAHPDPAPVLKLTVNSQATGTFSCDQGLLLSASLSNPASRTVRVDTVAVDLASLSSQCSSHAVALPPGGGSDVAAGASAEVLHADLTPEVCAVRTGGPGCQWRATARLATSAGPLSNEISFATAAPPDSPAPSANRPPRVSIRGGGECHPHGALSLYGAAPCIAEFVADATDPDDDAISYSWSGCASGDSRRVTCDVAKLAQYEVRVVVRDGRGGKDDATATARGVNSPPSVRYVAPAQLAPNTVTQTLSEHPFDDPDGDEDFVELCVSAAVTTSGPCSATLGSGVCGITGAPMHLDIRTLAGPGACKLDLSVRDSWGTVGKRSYEIPVTGP
jgi:hypothetical protein